MYHGDMNETTFGTTHGKERKGKGKNGSEPDQHWQPLADPLAAGSLVPANSH